MTDDPKFCANCGFNLSKAVEAKVAETLSSGAPIAECKPSLPQMSVPPIVPSPSPSVPILASETIAASSKPRRKWGWGAWVLFGWLYTSYSRMTGYSFGDTVNEKSGPGWPALLGVVVAMPVYLLLRNRSILVTKITNQFWRSFVSGCVAFLAATFVLTGTVWLVTSVAGKNLERDLQPLSVSIKTNNAKLIAEAKTFMQQYVHSPTDRDATGKNLTLIQEYLPALLADFKASVESLRMAESSIEKTCTITPALKGKYSRLGKFYHDFAINTEQRGLAYENWLINLKNYNISISRADGNADAYRDAAEKALTQVESKERELVSLVQQVSGQK